MVDEVRAHWLRVAERAQEHAAGCTFAEEPANLGNPRATYATLALTGLDGAALQARVVRPATPGPHPVVLMFHDATRGMRGWHHMTRFVALGHAVVALQNRAGVEGVLVREPLAVGDGLGVVMRVTGDEPVRTGRTLPPEAAAALEATLQDALVLAFLLPRLGLAPAARAVTWGEGLGGGLALAVAALADTRAACALGPLPAALDPSCATLDVARIACGYEGPVLLGTGMLDLQATPEAQDAIAEGLAHVRRIRYPRYGHERVNAYEDEQLAFLAALGVDEP